MSTQPRRSTWLSLIILLVVWEIVGLFDLVAQGALPAPSEILQQFWHDRVDYPRHITATLWAATLGFVIGNTIAILAAISFVLMPTLERLTRGISITLFAIPAIALVPILVIAFQGTTPRIVLAAVSVYFPTMVAMLVGLKQIDPRLRDVIATYAGGQWQLLLRVRLRSSMPALLSGLRVAAPAAVLGAILAEFGGGVRWGLGTYLLGSLGQANPARLWGIGLAATLVAGLAYGLFALLANRIVGKTQAVTIAAGASPEHLSQRQQESWTKRLLLLSLSIIVVLSAWALILELLNISSFVARSPLGVVNYLFFEPSSADARVRLLAALGETLPLALLGLLIGLSFAFAFAVLTTVWSALGQALLPVALVSQTMPLVALTPIIVLIFGRGILATIIVTVSVTFFPAFVTIAQGLALTPRSATDVVRAYGASKFMQLRLVSVPSALPYLFAAARLAAPRALLGVMIAEWLATGYGLGNLLNESRGRLDYGMIWAVAAVSVIIAVLFYQLIAAIERRILTRFAAVGA